MKAKINVDEKVREIKYPYLGMLRDIDVVLDKRYIVLFTSINAGTLVFNSWNNNPVGLYAEDWSEDQFDRFYGTVELEND